MSQKVWVTWKDASNNWSFTKVTNLNDNDDVDDLRKAFVKQQLLQISPATISVFRTKDDEKLKASSSLSPYFVRSGHDNNTEPGRSEDSALVLTIYCIQVIQQQQQQQQQWQQQQDVSLAWEASVSAAIANLSALTTKDDIKNFIFAPPNDLACVPERDFQAWKSVVPENVLRLYFRPVTTHEICRHLALYISNLLFIPSLIVGENEDGCHGRIDQCVATPLKRFAPTFTLRRNSFQDSSSSPLLRPDFSATLSGHGCFFRGEEKKPSSNEDPQAELYEKLHDVWPFPGFPFVLGYFSVGTNLTFACVYKNRTVALGNPLQLENETDRLKCWNATRNIARIMKHMTNYPSHLPKDLQDIEKGRGADTDWKRKISFSGGYVQKSIYLRDNETAAKVGRLKEVLEILQGGVDGVQPIISYSESSSVFDKRKRRKVPPTLYILSAFGASIESVTSTDHLRSIVVFLLNMKLRLNILGITHRDLRLPNILCNYNTRDLMLIDWDDSVKGLKDLSNNEVAHLDPASHAPEMFIEGGTHDHTVDLWSIGFLIKQHLIYADQPLQSFMKDCMKQANDRPEVTTAKIKGLANGNFWGNTPPTA